MNYVKDKKTIIIYLKEIGNSFKSEVKSIRNDSNNPQYRIITTNLIVVNYLTKYPLFGSKNLDFNNWLEVVKLFEKGFFNHKLNMEYVKQIKSNMNDKITLYMRSLTKILQLK